MGEEPTVLVLGRGKKILIKVPQKGRLFQPKTLSQSAGEKGNLKMHLL